MKNFDESGWTHHRVRVGEIEVHHVEAGPKDGPLVLLLHGFPELWYAWRLQIGALAAAGHRVVAPDLRGYGESEKPGRVRDYRGAALVGDVAGLISALGAKTATVVGHDWGGALAWMVAMHRPDLVERLVVLNAPHPGAFSRALRTFSQARRSWYIFFFQLPWLPERLLRAGDYRAIRKTLRKECRRPEGFTDADVERYIEAAARPGALTAAVNYYRAAVRQSWKDLFRPARPDADGPYRRVEVPTLIVWGEQDSFLGPELADPGRSWAPNLRLERLGEAAHWVQIDAPERVNALLLDFLAESPAPGGTGGKGSSRGVG